MSTLEPIPHCFLSAQPRLLSPKLRAGDARQTSAPGVGDRECGGGLLGGVGGGSVPHRLTAGPTSALICSGSFRPRPEPRRRPWPPPPPPEGLPGAPLPHGRCPQGAQTAARCAQRSREGPGPQVRGRK